MPDQSRFEIDDPRFRNKREQPPVESVEWLPETPVRKRSLLSSCLIGCLISFVVILAVLGIGVWWVSQHWRDWAASLGSEALKEGINATDLPGPEKDEIALQIDRVAIEFREGRLTADQLEFIFQNLMDSPLMTTIVASAIESKYVANSELDDAEKAEGRQTLRRFLRGAIDQKIQEDGIDEAMQHVATRNEEGNWELDDKVSDEQLRAFFKAAKAEADKANIPEEAEDIDPSDEFKRIIDEALMGQ